MPWKRKIKPDWCVGILLLILPTFLQAQTDSIPKWGRVSGQWRNFFMSTINAGSAKDFAAFATGGKLKYQYFFGKQLEVGAAFYSSINPGWTDLTTTDLATGKPSRYEAGLFNMQDLNQKEIALLGELYLNYKFSNQEVTLGRIKFVSPLVNPQDGRMIPTLLQGIWYTVQPVKKLNFGFGGFNKIAPRGTSRFYTIGESIGTYPVGRNPDGSVSGYFNETKSNLLLIGKVEWKPITPLTLEIWDYWVENVFHTLFIEPSYEFNLGKKKLQVKSQWIHQDRIHNGGNDDPAKRYFTDKKANIYGFQLGLLGKSSILLGYNRIGKTGRFLFPREWGRENIFSFQKRERSEGNADMHSLLITIDNSWNYPWGKFQNIISLGYHWNADVTNAKNNKYAMPDYSQLNVDLFYFHPRLKNLEPELLLTYKKGQGKIPDNPQFYFNKVDVLLISLVVNYNF